MGRFGDCMVVASYARGLLLDFLLGGVVRRGLLLLIRRRILGGLFLRRSRRRLFTLAREPCNDGVDRNGLPLLDEHLGQSSSGRRGDLGVDLVGRDLEQRFVPLDGVSDLLHPADDRSFGDGLSHLGHDYVDCHD